MPAEAPADDLGDWLRLELTAGVGPAAKRQLLAALGLPERIFAASQTALAAVVGDACARALLQGGTDQGVVDAIAAARVWAGQPGNRILTLADADYPRALLDTTDPPLLLYVKGRVEMLSRPMLAIVGSRNATAQGGRDATAFARALAEAGLTIVSGLALGIDAAAHAGAVDTAAGTLAVIGTGADRVYPARNATLARRIAEKGAIISEFPLGMPPLAANFPRRNRIIAGLALGTLVVEAAPQSGSLITARLALDVGRDVFAIPGSIHSPQSRGCHQLIRQGAKLVEMAQDILEELRWGVSAAKHSGGETAQLPLSDQSPTEEQVLTALGHGPCEIDTLTQLTGLTAGSLLAILLPMELAGRVAQLPGGRYQRLA